MTSRPAPPPAKPSAILHVYDARPAREKRLRNDNRGVFQGRVGVRMVRALGVAKRAGPYPAGQARLSIRTLEHGRREPIKPAQLVTRTCERHRWCGIAV